MFLHSRILNLRPSLTASTVFDICTPASSFVVNVPLTAIGLGNTPVYLND